MSALKTVLEKQWELYENEAKWNRHRELEIKEMEEKIAERYKGVPKKTIAVSCRICLRVRVATIYELVCVACGKITCTKCGKQDQGLWRCMLCRKKREYAMSSGAWYHGVQLLQRFAVQDMLNRIADEVVRRMEQVMFCRREEPAVQQLTPATNDAQLRSPPTIACIHNAKETTLKETEEGDDEVFEDDNEGTDKYLNFPLPEDGSGIALAARSVTQSDRAFDSATTFDPNSSSDDDDVFLQVRVGEPGVTSEVNRETRETFDEKEQNDRMQSRKKAVIAPEHTPMIRKVILWKDLQVSSETSGLAFGIKIVGGKMCSGGFMGASITKVTSKYLADQKLFEGDQILEWNRISMVDVTFEEAKTIVDGSHEKVAVIIYHNPTCPPAKPPLPSGERISQAIRERRKTYEGIKCSSQRSLVQLMIENDSSFPQGDGGVKKESNRGKIQLNLWHDPHGRNIVVQVVKARGLSLQDTPNQELPSCYVLLNLLPNREISGQFRTNTDPETVNPHWNLSFVFTNVTEVELTNITLELTLWSENLRRHSFLGEVMVQMSQEVLQRGTQWFDIMDPDEKCIPLPIPMPRRHTVSSCDPLPCVEEPGQGKTFWWNNDTKVKKYSYPSVVRSVSAYNLSNCKLLKRDAASDNIGLHLGKRRRTEAIVTMNNLRLTAETDGQERRTELFRGCLRRYSGIPGYFSAPTTPHITASNEDIQRKRCVASFGDRLHVPPSPFGVPPTVLSLDALKRKQRSSITEGTLESYKWRSGTDEQEYLKRQKAFTASSDTTLRSAPVSLGSCMGSSIQQENKDEKKKGPTKARKRRPSNLRIRLGKLTDKEAQPGDVAGKRSRRLSKYNGMPGYFSAPTTPHITISTEDIRREGSVMSFGDRLHVPPSPFGVPPTNLSLDALKQKQRSSITEGTLESDKWRSGTDDQDEDNEEQPTWNLPLITIESVTSTPVPSESPRSGETDSGDDQQAHNLHSPEETTNEKKGPVSMLRRYSRSVMQRTKKIPSEDCLFGNEPIRGLVGPGQFRRSSFTEDLGYIRIGLVASHDALEVEIIRAVAIPCPGDRLPDTYVKTYLIKDQVRIEKRKTSLVRQNANPVYNCRMKYPGCELFRKELLVSVWCKQGIFGRKILLGEVNIALGSLNLADKQTSWYRLYVECPLSDL